MLPIAKRTLLRREPVSSPIEEARMLCTSGQDKEGFELRFIDSTIGKLMFWSFCCVSFETEKWRKEKFFSSVTPAGDEWAYILILHVYLFIYLCICPNCCSSYSNYNSIQQWGSLLHQCSRAGSLRFSKPAGCGTAKFCALLCCCSWLWIPLHVGRWLKSNQQLRVLSVFCHVYCLHAY